HDGEPALEETRVGVLRAVLLRAGQRVAADERHPGGQAALDVADDRGLGAAGVGQQGAGAAAGGGLTDLFGDAIDRRAGDGELGPADGRQVERRRVDGADGQGPVEAGPLPADADDAAGDAALLGRQADGAADQADADDGEGLQLHSTVTRASGAGQHARDYTRNGAAVPRRVWGPGAARRGGGDGGRRGAR